jgi:hypothetical protein
MPSRFLPLKPCQIAASIDGGDMTPYSLLLLCDVIGKTSMAKKSRRKLIVVPEKLQAVVRCPP